MRYKYKYRISFNHSTGLGVTDMVVKKPIEKILPEVKKYIELNNKLIDVGISNWKLIRKQRVG